METKTDLKILFLYNHQYPELWKDGLYAAIELLSKQYTITKVNIAKEQMTEDPNKFDVILGWGGFNSPVDHIMQLLQQTQPSSAKYHLLLAGNAFPLRDQKYDGIFYETDWTMRWLIGTHKGRVPNLTHAFGYNSQIYNNLATLEIEPDPLFDYLTVGAFSTWKRQAKLLEKDGIRLAIGEIQKDNLSESMGIVAPLLMDGVMVSDMVSPWQLAKFYHQANIVVVFSDLYGGGERAVLEAQACGCRVEVEKDNPKLQQLIGLDKLKWTEHYYAEQLNLGIQEEVSLREQK